MTKEPKPRERAAPASIKPARERARNSRASSAKDHAKLLRISELRYQELKQELRQELEDVGFICVGSLSTIYQTCGNPHCRCHQDPGQRHGPYHYWTRKVNGRTVTVLLKKEQVPLFQERIENNRRVDKLVQEMRRISVQAVSAEAKGVKGGA